jgi:hypothetical protein
LISGDGIYQRRPLVGYCPDDPVFEIKMGVGIAYLEYRLECPIITGIEGGKLNLDPLVAIEARAQKRYFILWAEKDRILTSGFV